MDVILDTNILVGGLMSNRGASHQVIREVLAGNLIMHVSVPLVLEYEAVLLALEPRLPFTDKEIVVFIDSLIGLAEKHDVFFVWRPTLRDRDDEMILELAVAADVRTVLTFNIRDFRGMEQFGVRAITPGQFIAEWRDENG